MRSNNMALKNEKLKAEHERNLVEIKARQLEEAMTRMQAPPAPAESVKEGPTAAPL